MNSSTLKGILFVAVAACSTTTLIGQCQHTRQYYSQPVYTQPVYAQPVYVQPSYTPMTIQPATTTANRVLTAAEAARMHTQTAKGNFARKEYALAVKELNQVVELAPKDSNAYQFRSLANFAKGDFEEAAADAYDSLSLGPAWTSPVIQSLYGDAEKARYATHLESLKASVGQKPSMQGHFLLAYHHLMGERWNQGKAHLQKVLELKPDEPLSTKLLAAVESRLTQSSTSSK